MTEKINITAEPRRDAGKGVARQLRRNGYIPAVVYGAGKDPLPLQISEQVLDQALRRGGSGRLMLDLVIDTGSGQEVRPVIIRELQQDVVSLKKLHVDFLEVRPDEEITDTVPLEVFGEPDAISQGGLLEVLRRDLKVTALPDKLPRSIRVDAGGLEMGDAIRVSEITPPEGVTILFDEDYPVVVLNKPKRVSLGEEEAEGEAVEGEEAEEGQAAEAQAGQDQTKEE
jgi:large subunit ribosomal protein L25